MRLRSRWRATCNARGARRCARGKGEPLAASSFLAATDSSGADVAVSIGRPAGRRPGCRSALAVILAHGWSKMETVSGAGAAVLRFAHRCTPSSGRGLARLLADAGAKSQLGMAAAGAARLFSLHAFAVSFTCQPLAQSKIRIAAAVVTSSPEVMSVAFLAQTYSRPNKPSTRDTLCLLAPAAGGHGSPSQRKLEAADPTGGRQRVGGRLVRLVDPAADSHWRPFRGDGDFAGESE